VSKKLIEIIYWRFKPFDYRHK